MKTIFTTCLLIITLSIQAQKIKINEVDKFTNKKRVETNNLLIKMGLSNSLQVNFRSNGELYFMQFIGNYSPGIVGTNDPIIFLFDNKDTAMIYPKSLQTTSGFGSNEVYYHEYIVNESFLKKLKNQVVTSIRKYASKSYVDLDINDKKAKKLSSLADLFLQNLK